MIIELHPSASRELTRYAMNRRNKSTVKRWEIEQLTNALIRGSDNRLSWAPISALRRWESSFCSDAFCILSFASEDGNTPDLADLDVWLAFTRPKASNRFARGLVVAPQTPGIKTPMSTT